MNNNNDNKKTRSKSQRMITRLHMEKILSNAGYFTEACHLPRWHVLALLFIAVSQLGAIKKTPPKRVIKTIKFLLILTMRGQKFTPNYIHANWAKWQRGREERMAEADAAEIVDGKYRCPLCGGAGWMELESCPTASLDPEYVAKVSQNLPHCDNVVRDSIHFK